jgi:hypothetical protein
MVNQLPLEIDVIPPTCHPCESPVILRVEGVHLMVIVDVMQVVNAATIAQTDQE